MELFKKKEPLIVADMAADAMPPAPLGSVPGGSAMSATGSLTKMVEQTLALEEENNRMLKSMQTMDRIMFWLKILFWSLVLGLPVIFFQPLITYVKEKVAENPGLIGLPTSEDFYKAIDEFSTKHPVQ
ncbi:MAG: hypothetical protein AAB921_02460 [Patescibacteria group bacterium]